MADLPQLPALPTLPPLVASVLPAYTKPEPWLVIDPGKWLSDLFGFDVEKWAVGKASEGAKAFFQSDGFQSFLILAIALGMLYIALKNIDTAIIPTGK